MAESDLTQFDYKYVAKIDADAWRSYYNHQFFKMFLQLLRGMKKQLNTNWTTTLRLAFYSGRAAASYRVKKGNENYPKVLKDLIKYYKILNAHSLQKFDYEEAAKLELEWWDIHRYPNRYKKSLEASLADAAAVVYKVHPETLRKYARYRAEAMMIPNHVGDKGKVNPEKDYQEIEALLLKSWEALHKAVQR